MDEQAIREEAKERQGLTTQSTLGARPTDVTDYWLNIRKPGNLFLALNQTNTKASYGA